MGRPHCAPTHKIILFKLDFNVKFSKLRLLQILKSSLVEIIELKKMDNYFTASKCRAKC